MRSFGSCARTRAGLPKRPCQMRQRQHSHVAVPALGHFESVSELNVETPETKAVSRRLYRHREGVGRVGDLRQSTPEMPRAVGGSEVLRQWREKNCNPPKAPHTAACPGRLSVPLAVASRCTRMRHIHPVRRWGRVGCGKRRQPVQSSGLFWAVLPAMVARKHIPGGRVEL